MSHKAYVKTLIDRTGRSYPRWQVRLGPVVIGEYVTRYTADKIAAEINSTKQAAAAAIVREVPREAP